MSGNKENTRVVIKSLELEYRRYRDLGEKALAQVQEEQLSQPGPSGGNSLLVLVQHLSSNLKSRFTDFLTSDGEKPWRDRDSEFVERQCTRGELVSMWNEGWQILEGALRGLTDEDLNKSVKIRDKELLVVEALHRSLAHASYHVGQMLYLAKIFCGESWNYLTIPPGGSAQYNKDPALERGFRAR